MGIKFLSCKGKRERKRCLYSESCTYTYTRVKGQRIEGEKDIDNEIEGRKVRCRDGYNDEELNCIVRARVWLNSFVRQNIYTCCWDDFRNFFFGIYYAMKIGMTLFGTQVFAKFFISMCNYTRLIRNQ